jgi:pimeloyl-ACP methyl ester carboxylesterase
MTDDQTPGQEPSTDATAKVSGPDIPVVPPNGRRSRRGAAAGVLLAAAVAVTGVVVLASGGADDGKAAPLTWGTCSPVFGFDEVFECATLEVPLDHSEPGAKKISLALVRLPAEGARKGILLTNPGGPGGSGLRFVSDAGESLASDVRLRGFDIVGFDPRGVGASSPVTCYEDADLDEFMYLDDTPDNDREQALFDKWDADETDACVTKFGGDLRHYSTEATARDMDLIRAAMGEEKMSFLGISYGTHLGAVYASLFPDRVQSMMLDGGYDPEADTMEEEYLTQARGFEESFDRWAYWCQEQAASCAFRSADVRGAWVDLYDRLDAESIVTTSGREANHRVLKTATIAMLYSREAWSYLGEILADAARGDGEAVLSSADSYRGRRPDGGWGNDTTAQYVISCSSGFGETSPPDPVALLAKLRAAAPWYSMGTEVEDFEDIECDKAYGDGKVFPVSYSGSAPVVVVGGLRDPATPFRWSEELAARLGPSSRLVSVDADGHSHIIGSECVNSIASRLFNSGVLPAAGTKC